MDDPLMPRSGVYILVLAACATVLSPAVRAGGFDRAIESAGSRTVKLYGLGAGLQAGYGSGIIVSEDGLVLTVFSLLIDARTIRATASDGTRYEAEVVHRDTERQLALLKLVRSSHPNQPNGTMEQANDAALRFPFFDLSARPELRRGDWLIAAGNPFKVADGAEPVSIAHGVFSAKTRLDARRRTKEFPYTGDVLVIDSITSNPGAPGSALVNLEGRLVGMIGRVVISELTHTHFNYAYPVDVLHEFFLEATGVTPSQPEPSGRADEDQPRPVDLGLRLSKAGYRKVLPFVERVRRGSPAARAGIRPDDLILSINGKTVGDVQDCNRRLETLSPREPVVLVIRRGRAIHSVRIEREEE
jgi:S1-C subfamily serine protease